MVKIRNMFNYVRLPGKYPRGRSNTLPDKSLTISQIMARFVRGEPLGLRQTYYEDDDINEDFNDRYDTLRDYDLSEIEELKLKHNENVERIKQANAEREQRINKANADKEYLSRLQKEGYAKSVNKATSGDVSEAPGV